MSMRLEMLQVARLAPGALGESAELVHDFLLGQLNEDGGFRDRAGKSDLYYTVFGIDGLLALQAEVPVSRTIKFLEKFGAGSTLDFVHLCCLARCWSGVARHELASATKDELLARIEQHRAADGGYHPIAGSPCGTVYGSFLAAGASQDLAIPIPEPLRIVQSLKFLETSDGAWANERGVGVGSTNATAAAVTLLRNLGMPITADAGDWLLAQHHRDGGFLAAPGTPMPDLLSTATALHALAGLQVPFGAIKDKCLDFVDTLWTNEGGFHGHWADDELDCEYTFYGLLALGHLSL